VVLALVSLLAACTGGQSSKDPASSSSSASPSASSTGPVTLRFAVYGDADTVATYRTLAEAFTAKHPQVTIKIESAPDKTIAQNRLDAGFEKGTAPDVFLADHDQLPLLVADGRVQPVDELLEQRGVLFGDSFDRLGLESPAADSALQCMPNDVSPYVVFYNRRLFPEEVRTPDGDASMAPAEDGWTWEQFAAAAQQMSHGQVKGVYLPPQLTTLIPLVRSAGSDLMDDQRKPTTLTFSDDANRGPLETILQVARDPILTPTTAQLGREDAVSRFMHGRIGMMVGTRALVPRLHRLLHQQGVGARARGRRLHRLREPGRGRRDHRGVRRDRARQPRGAALGRVHPARPLSARRAGVQLGGQSCGPDAVHHRLAEGGDADTALPRPAVLRAGRRPGHVVAADRRAVGVVAGRTLGVTVAFRVDLGVAVALTR
jgi:ABC-type glycerol-3-phosphate transport system substrate-binding protein